MAQQEFILGWLGGLGAQPLLGQSKGSNNGLYEISQMGVVARGASTKLDLRNSSTEFWIDVETSYNALIFALFNPKFRG